MIVRDAGDRWLLIRQTDHAEQCGRMASHWGNDQFAMPVAADAVMVGAALHDTGWREWEDGQQTGAILVEGDTGEPRTFYRVRGKEHFDLYRRGIQRTLAVDPYAGLLVSMHGVGLHNGRYGRTPDSADPDAGDPASPAGQFIAEQARLQQELRLRLQADPCYRDAATDVAVWNNYQLLQVWDLLSLHLCMRALGDGEIPQTPLTPGGALVNLQLTARGNYTLALDPYPFDRSPLLVGIKALVIPKERYLDNAALLVAMQRAQSVTLPFELVAP
jgi:hypothetical protein